MKCFVKRLSALLLSTAFLGGFQPIQLVPTYQNIYAAETLTLTPLTSASGENVAVPTSGEMEGKLEVRFQSSQYGTFSQVLANGYTTLNINYNVTNYTANGTAGVQPFVTYGTNWKNGGVWNSLSNGASGSLSLDLTQFPSSDDSVQFGVQIANISGTASYNMSATLSGNGSGSGSSGGETGGKLANSIDLNSNPVDINYAKLLQESLYFYDANMCGNDVDERSEFSWRDDCHTLDSTITYNGKTIDLSGGFHDAGDHVKFGLPAAVSASTLGLTYYEYKDVFDKLGQSAHYKRIADHFTEYFEKCTLLDESGNVTAFCYQVGNGYTDHAYQRKPEDQDSAQGQRQAFFTSDSTPCTDVVSETAAALAIYAINFDDDKALTYAKALFNYADTHEKKSGGDGMWDFYYTTSCEDDYALAATMLYRATGEEKYKTAYYRYVNIIKNCGWPLCWNNVHTLANLYSPDGEVIDNSVYTYINKAASQSTATDGYVFINPWASTKYNLALQYLGVTYDKLRGTDVFSDWAEGQMSYILGNNGYNNGNGYCFVVGYNDKSVKKSHHRAVYDSDSFPNDSTPVKHLLLGALVGGPTVDDYQGPGVYTPYFYDNSSDYTTSEVALDYNAPLVAAAAAGYYYTVNNGTDEEKALQKTISISSVEGIELRSLSTLKGDINSDGNADYLDAYYILRHILGKVSLTTSQADVNNDNNIDLKDAVKLMQ